MTRSKSTPRRRSSGKTSAALAHTPSETASRLALGAFDAGEGRVESRRHLVEVAGVEAPLDARRVDLDGEDCGACHGRGERLRATHAAETRGENGAAGEIG